MALRNAAALTATVAGSLFLAPLFAAEATLPDGPGKELVAANCGNCHEMTRVTNSGYTPENWKTVMAMMGNLGLQMADRDVATVTAYLTKNFPERPRPPAVLVDGPVHVTFTEWVVPTPGSRPHDPLAASDGSIWYTGQYANVLGRVDPATGKIREFKIPVAQSGPHGLTEDKDGNIWFTANFKAYVGKLDPKTGKFTEFRTNDPNARDPHTPLFDQKGRLWFTMQQGNMVGRLDPKTGEMKLATAPTPRSLPYGMVITTKGVPFFDLFGTNKLASIDPETMKITEYTLPDPAARPRRIAITSDDVIYYSDYARGYLGRLDPKTGNVTEWPSPGGPRSQPYGIASIRDVIWYSEAGVGANTLVRFDPKTEKFQTWKIPSTGGVVRNVSVTRDGKLAMAYSGVNGIGLAEIH